MKFHPFLPLLFLLLEACGARTGFADLPITACGDAPPTCIAPSQFCEAPRAVDAVCDAATKQYACPPGTKTYERVDDGAVCLPFHKAPIESLSGSLVRVPLDGGQCLWVADEARMGAKKLRNIGIRMRTTLPFGACPEAAVIDENIVTADPSQIVQITGGYRLGGRTHVTYRLFRENPGAPFGVEHLGSGIARFDGGRIVIPREVRFATDLDLGDASLVIGDRTFVWGCPGPPDFLTERCVVGRLDADDAMELFTGSNWVRSTRGSDGKTVFDAGPWVSSVTATSGTLRHIFAVGFGTNLEMHTANAPEGPWSAGVHIAPCALPSGDEKAFCAGPVVHDALADPTRPNELFVTYGVGTLRPGERAPADYWPRLQRVP